MTECIFSKILIIIIYLIIIILIPLFIYYLFKFTVDKRRIYELKQLALEKSKQTGKSLIIFNDKSNGTVADTNEKFSANITDVIDQMADNSCVILLVNVLEYIDNNSIKELIKQLNRVSGGDLYIISIGKKSPKIIMDYNIINVMNKSFYLPGDKISYYETTPIQKNIQKIYYYVFKILPYKLLETKNI